MMNNDAINSIITTITSKYKNSNHDIHYDEDELIQQAENLLSQFGIKPKKKKHRKNQSSKTSKAYKNDKSFIQSCFNIKKKDLFQNNQNNLVTALILAPNSEHEKESNNLKISQVSDEEKISVTNNPNQSETRSNQEKIIEIEYESEEINTESLNELLDEIEEEFNLKTSTQTKKRKANFKKTSNSKPKKILRIPLKPILNDNKIDKNLEKEKENSQNDKSQTSSESQKEKIDDQIIKIQQYEQAHMFKIWKRCYNLKIKYKNALTKLNAIKVKFYFKKWAYILFHIKRRSRLEEFNRMKQVEDIGKEYMIQIFLRKFLLLWLRQLHISVKNKKMKILQQQREIHQKELQIKKEKELEKQKVKIGFKPYKFIKKPPPPPIPVDPKMDQLVRKGFENKANKIAEVKKQIKQEKIQKEIIQKQVLEEGQKKRIQHIKELKNQKKNRILQNHKNEEKIRQHKIYEGKCKNAEEHYKIALERRIILQWKKVLYMRNKHENECLKQVHLLIQRIYFRKMIDKFAHIENNLNYIANTLSKKLLMKKAIKAIIKVKEVRKSKIPLVHKIHNNHLVKQYFREWKIKKIASRRMKENKASEHYERMLLKKAFKGFPQGIKNLNEENKRNVFKHQLIANALKYIEDNSDTLEFTANSMQQRKSQQISAFSDTFKSIIDFDLSQQHVQNFEEVDDSF